MQLSSAMVAPYPVLPRPSPCQPDNARREILGAEPKNNLILLNDFRIPRINIFHLLIIYKRYSSGNPWWRLAWQRHSPRIFPKCAHPRTPRYTHIHTHTLIDIYIYPNISYQCSINMRKLITFPWAFAKEYETVSLISTIKPYADMGNVRRMSAEPPLYDDHLIK